MVARNAEGKSVCLIFFFKPEFVSKYYRDKGMSLEGLDFAP